YLRQRRVDIRSGLVFGAATLPGAVGGALLVGHVPRRAFDAIMAVVLGSVAVWLSIYRRFDLHRTLGGSPRLLVDAGGREWRYAVPVGRGIGSSVAVGFLSSFLGIGGGIFHVPILVTLLGFPTHIATATSHFVLALMSGAGVVTHIAQGAYRTGNGLRRSLVLAVGLAVGAQLGARLSTRTSSVAIERLLVAELAELAGDEIGDLLADVDRVVADALDAPRDDEHAQPVLALLRRVAEREDVLGGVPVRAIDQLVQLDECLRLLVVAGRERVHRHADHLLRALTHVFDRTADRIVDDVEVAHQLRELGDRHAIVRHPLQVQVHAQNRKHEAQIDRHG